VFSSSIIIGGFSVFAIVMVLINSKTHRTRQDKLLRRFLDEEAAANSVRKKEIPQELFYTPDLSIFPPVGEDDPFQVTRCAKRVMLRFEKFMSNLELKKLYGVAQMDLIAQYEENFNAYLKALTKWAEALAQEGSPDAIKILEYVISRGGEYRDTYRTAADIYAKNGEQEKLDELITQAENNHFRDTSIRDWILGYINGKKNSL